MTAPRMRSSALSAAGALCSRASTTRSAPVHRPISLPFQSSHASRTSRSELLCELVIVSSLIAHLSTLPHLVCVESDFFALSSRTFSSSGPLCPFHISLQRSVHSFRRCLQVFFALLFCPFPPFSARPNVSHGYKTKQRFGCRRTARGGHPLLPNCLVQGLHRQIVLPYSTTPSRPSSTCVIYLGEPAVAAH